MNTISDIDNIRIDLLKEAQKDVTETIRALDRKISFIMAFKTFLISGSTYLLTHILNDCSLKENTLLITIVILIIFTIFLSLLNSIWQLQPKLTPKIPFAEYSPDFDYADNTLFIFTNPDIYGNVSKKIHLYELISNLDKNTEDINKIKKTIYKEITKLSYIRDLKISRMKLDNMFILIFILIIIIAIVGLI